VTPQDAAPSRTDSFRPVLGAAVALFMALLALAGLKSWRDLEAARERERILETRIADTRARSDRLRARIERLRTDPGALERLAREDLGMVRPGDVVIELPVEPAIDSRRGGSGREGGGSTRPGGPALLRAGRVEPPPHPPDPPLHEGSASGGPPTPAAGSAGPPPPAPAPPPVPAAAASPPGPG
jgi:cell division protein FtsB